MQLRPGLRLASPASEVELVVVKAPATEVEVGCGAVPMVVAGEEGPTDAVLDASLGDGPLLGKGDADDDIGAEVLCSRAGTSALTIDGRILSVKGAKPLPSSD